MIVLLVDKNCNISFNKIELYLLNSWLQFRSVNQIIITILYNYQIILPLFFKIFLIISWTNVELLLSNYIAFNIELLLSNYIAFFWFDPHL